MDSVSPVLTENEVQFERVIALDQPQYYPIIILPIQYDGGHFVMGVRFRFTDKERKLIAEGADIFIQELTDGQSFTPINIQLCKPGEFPTGE